MSQLTVLSYKDAYLMRQASLPRSQTVSGTISGIVSGLVVQQNPGSLELQVTSGAAVVNGVYLEFTSTTTGLYPATNPGIVDGVEVFVTLSLVRSSTTTTNRFGQSVLEQNQISSTFSIVYADQLVQGNADQLVLACVRYQINARDTGIGSTEPVQLPLNVLGIYTTLGTANTALFGVSVLDPFTNTTGVETNGSVIVSPDNGLSAVVWSMVPVADPVQVTYQLVPMSGGDTYNSTYTAANGNGFVLIGTTTTYVTCNIAGQTYTISWPTGQTGSSVPFTVYGSLSTESIQITGTGATTSVTCTFTFPGDVHSHALGISWSTGSGSETVSGLWIGLSSTQMVGFSYADTAFALPWKTRDWSLTVPVVGSEEDAYLYDIIGITTEVDATSNTYPFLSPKFTGQDLWHRSQETGFATSNNPHGIGFNDIGYGVMPLHLQLFQRGFGVATMATHGIVGQAFQETIASENIATDYFGYETGILANRYLRLRHVPLNVASLVDAGTGAGIPYTIENDVIVLGPEFVGGDFSIYPTFALTSTYSVGQRVTYVVSGTLHVYQCIVNWTPNQSGALPPDPAYFQDLVIPVGVTVNYFYIPDLEYYVNSDNVIWFSPNNADPVVSNGIVIEPTVSTNRLGFDLGAYRGINIPTMTLSLDGTGTVVSTEQALDTVDISTRQASQPGFANSLTGACQVKIYLTQTPIPYQLPPLNGTLTVTSTAFYGHVRLFYTYAVQNITVFSTTSQVSAFSGDLDLSTAQLIDGVNYIPRNQWEYSYATNQVIIAGSVYVPGRTYRLIRHATETQRNMSGYVDVIGTNAAPAGVSATALISVSDYGRFSQGDSITITIPGQSPVTKTLSGTGAGYTGFVLGVDITTTLQNIAAAFELDPTFTGAGCTCQLSSVNANTLMFSAPGGSTGNSYTLQVQSTNTAFQLNQNFTGGADHTWIFDDLSGLGFTVNDTPVPDTTGYFSIWSTGNLDQGADANQYYRVCVEDDNYTGTVSGTIVTQTGSNVLVNNLVLGAGWTGSNLLGYMHTVGTVGVMTDPTVYVVGSLYRILYTVSNRTAGSVSVYAGGITTPVTGTGSVEVVFTAVDSLVVTPTQDFNGTISIAIEYLADNIDLGNELSLSVQITGTDAEGNSLQETLVLDASNFCDVQNFRINNPYTNARSVNIYNGISSWTIMSQSNAGSSILTVIAETASGTQNLFNLCDVNWNGDGVQWIRDQRNFVDATTNTPTASTTAEALSSVAALMQIQYLTYQAPTND